MKYNSRVPPAPRAAGSRRWLLAPIAAALLLLLVAAWRLVHSPPPVAPAITPAAPPPRRPPPRRHVLPVLPVLPAPDPPEPEDEPAAPDAGAPVVEEGPPVTGVVLDPDGKPIEGASVVCDDRDPPVAASTNAEGRFELAAAAEDCQGIARHGNFAPSERTVLAAGRANRLQLNRPGGIDGDVVDEGGAPVAAFVVGVESYRGPAFQEPPRRSRLVDDPTGAFALSGLPPGEYVLSAGAEGRPPVPSRRVTVEVGRTTHHVRITLPLGATLTGTVIDADTRRPLAGARVRLDAMTSTDADQIPPASSDDAGVYALRGAPRGPFSIRVTLDGYRRRVVTGLTTRGGGTLRQDVELHRAGDDAHEEMTGIGAYLAPTPSGVTVGSVVEGGPADAAGLLPGDRIARIDGADASAFTLVDCMQRLRGPEGSRVDVQVDRGGRRVDVTIQRRLIAY